MKSAIVNASRNLGADDDGCLTALSLGVLVNPDYVVNPILELDAEVLRLATGQVIFRVEVMRLEDLGDSGSDVVGEEKLIDSRG
jgi:hypothetical protein